ncbi:hypothetical protein SD70_25165 [Gordoniibacillus kamchatkensis]|uniref:Uncharacterized protein n=1 Tax=Gordoniibacillus kamchatkensis TaxID=1590651 RepID=A0ABR5ACH1_9BACL|nr:hypothetical protein [Paenibacillus sp. VKM B-2647]KIL38660.1 hypothetical protein SD70_25165 [Paenibacillus sp. VKM B-2647]
MVFIFFLLVNAGFAFAFFSIRKKRLLPIEIFLYWCLSAIFVQNYSAIQTMNFKSSINPNEPGPEFAHLLNRTVLYPVLGMLFLNSYCALKSGRMKLVCILSFAALTTGIEWLSSVLGVFVHVWLKLWWSAAFWLIHNLLLVGIMKMFRRKLYAGGTN